MTREEFPEAGDKHVTVRIVDEQGFNRLVNVIPNTGAGGAVASFVGLEEDLRGVEAKMLVKFPEKKRGVVQRVASADGMTNVGLAGSQAPGVVVPAREPAKLEGK